ncbi:MAG: DUF4249 family protein [Gemmatimonadetes bacterium]|nr:DUF4249 family protein [Gemmatimonadota bacterium]
MKRSVALLVAGLIASGCKLSEEGPVPPGTSMVVVYSVLNTARDSQDVFLERSLDGTSRFGPTAVNGATVTLTYQGNGPCDVPEVKLDQVVVDSPLTHVQGGWYTTTRLCPLSAGDRVALRVETPDGAVVTGSTRIPGVRAALAQSANAVLPLPPSRSTVDRTRDTITIEIDPVGARGVQVEWVSGFTGSTGRYSWVTDATQITVPITLVNPVDEEVAFRAGEYYTLTVAATDTNTFDFMRSGNDPFTARGFANHLSGGIGVFGSVAPVSYYLKVTAPQRDPREGVYRVTGQLEGTAVDVTWDVYLDIIGGGASVAYSAFVEGTWVDGPVSGSGGGGVTQDRWDAILVSPTNLGPSQGIVYRLNGYRAPPGTPFPVRVDYFKDGIRHTGTLIAVQVAR